MKEFKNIPSKLYEKTENWIAKEKNLTKAKYPNNFNESKPKPRRIMSASAAHSHRIIIIIKKKIQCSKIITMIKWFRRN